ncbi:MAG: two component transcriptional regulator, LuxR family [Phycisphaerales bacterium]|jgi:two-component system response regulator NreC|nr:two component transcriptional regulator, LuxR family [Phycisphaerales bacterium]MDB5358525.1 two component transcriptional regulator, LuxR family [Phycisphaerales bacterium]
MSTRVLLVEDHTLVRSGIRSLLDSSPEVKVVGDVKGGREAVEFCQEHRPDLVLTDVEMPALNGIETARQLHALLPELRIVMLSMHDDPQYVFESLKAGASGYVLKDAAFTELLAAIRVVMSGRRYLSPPLADLVMDDYVRRANGEATGTDLDKLSAREREVLQLVAEGRSSAQVAAMIHISVRTVDTHRYNVMQKLGIHSIAGLTKFAIAHGLTSLR